MALVPLDERPVNVELPIAIAAIAGADLVLPPDELMPDIRVPGQADAIGDWLAEVAPKVDAAVVSVDTLAFGGLIAARTTDDSVVTALSRLDRLRALKATAPDLPIAAVSLVMRATNSYNPQEEPLYWAEVGKELHRLGALHHRDFLVRAKALADDGNAAELQALRDSLDPAVIADFEQRRLRNHQVNLAMLGMAAERSVDPLLITADDTAEYAAGSLEQVWLGQWMTVLPTGGEVLMYPGADEVAAVLVARQLTCLSGVAATFAVACAEDDGLGRIAKYENSSIETAVARQLKASGARLVTDDDAEVLVIHAPDPHRRDFVHDKISFDEVDRLAADKTAKLIARLLGEGRRVALADLRYANGGDPLLVENLIANGLALKLSAYGGWNTAGNSLGSVVAAAAAAQIGRAMGTLDEGAARRMLIHRLLEDYAYQSVARPQLERRLDADYKTRKFEAEGLETSIETNMTAELTTLLHTIAPGATGVTNISFPWHRSFEINFVLTGVSA
ncbi:hypothetical protein WH87_10465 [Devosia epidermidihirudinis]|uniref:DUF4127 family protein n=1 Tax=Devosia epidermidihirudinis TaxID=1293439 RepID=A0A0F5QE63_9HYPH|nr:hypothetical protein WH87_10465 [Devosia epidermidihirudinis]